jgi:hypothetical protein
LWHIFRVPDSLAQGCSNKQHQPLSKCPDILLCIYALYWRQYLSFKTSILLKLPLLFLTTSTLYVAMFDRDFLCSYLDCPKVFSQLGVNIYRYDVRHRVVIKEDTRRTNNGFPVSFDYGALREVFREGFVLLIILSFDEKMLLSA